MSQTFRSRDEQIEQMFISYGQIHNQCVRDWILRHILEAEARGAAGERGEVADGQEPSAWTWVHDHGDVGWRREFSVKEPHRCFDFMRDIAPLYTRPANVAALEARIAELEEEVAKLNGGIRNPDDVTCALMDSQYVAGAKFGWNCAQDDDPESLTKMIERRLRDRIEAGVSFSDRSRDARAALKREGGV